MIGLSTKCCSLEDGERLGLVVGAEVPVGLDQAVKHGESVLGLVHGYHVAGLVDTEEVKVAGLAHLTGGFARDVPLLVFLSRELLLGAPLGGGGPGLTTSPVADPVLITRVDENISIGLVEDFGDLRHEVGHPVTEEVSVDHLLALNPLAARDAKSLLDIIAVEEGVGGAEIVAERRLSAWNTDVINVDLGVERVTNAGVSHDLASLESGNVEDFATLLLGLVDETLAGLEATVEDISPSLADEAVLIGELGVLRVLLVGVGKTVTNGDTLKVKVHISRSEFEVVSDGGNVVSGIGLTGDEEVTASVLGVLLKEASKHDSHVLSDLGLVLGVMETAGREAGTDGLVDVEKVSRRVPRVRVGLKGRAVIVELVRTVLVEEGDLAGAAGASSEPKDERIGGGCVSGLEHPVEDIILVAVDGHESALPLVITREDTGGIIEVGVGVSNSGEESEGLEHL